MTRIKDEYHSKDYYYFSSSSKTNNSWIGDIGVSLRIINEARVDTDFSTIFNDFRSFERTLERDIYRFSRITQAGYNFALKLAEVDKKEKKGEGREGKSGTIKGRGVACIICGDTITSTDISRYHGNPRHSFVEFQR